MTDLTQASSDRRTAPEGSVSLQFVDTTGIVTLGRAEARNALDARMVRDIAWAFDTAEAAPEVRAIVVTGDGSAFCAGAVLDTLIASAGGDFASVKVVYEGFLRVMASPLPTIAAVNGPAVGAGLNLALACDVRIAARTARFESRFPQLQLHPGGGHTWLLEKAVGRQSATLMALFGQVLSADDAREAGLVASVHDNTDLIAAALRLGGKLADMDPRFARTVVQTLREAEQLPTHDEVFARETERQQWSIGQQGFLEHTRALQRRISSSAPTP